MSTTIAERWDDEYRSGRYIGEGPVAFVDAIVGAVSRERPPGDRGLYIGCGNGRNYLPLLDSGLDLVGLDVSSIAIEQLKTRRPDRANSLICGDVHALSDDARFGCVIGIQVFQHGRETDAHAHIRTALDHLLPGGLFCIRVNAAGTQLECAHKLLETNPTGGFTVQYQDGPKQGLAVHFFSRAELNSVMRGLQPVMPMRISRTYRKAPARGYWDQWEGIWKLAYPVSSSAPAKSL